MKRVLAGFLIIILSAVLLLSAACSKQETQSSDKQKSAKKDEPKKKTSSVAGKKACDVFSVEEASAVMGTKLAEGSDETSDYDNVPGAEASYCGFTNNANSVETLRAMTVVLYRFPDASIAHQSLKAAKELLGNDAETVNGLGDGAYWSPNTLFVQQGEDQLAVTVIQPEKGGPDKAKAEAAAKIILPRL